MSGKRHGVAVAAGLLVLAACRGRHAERPPPEPYDASTPPLPVLYDVMVPKRRAPGGDVTGQTTCGMSMVMHERRGTSTRVTVRDDSFWVDDDDIDRAPHAYARCFGPLVLRDARVSDALVRSLTPPVLQEADAWEDIDPTLPKTIYERDEENTSCVEFQFDSDRLAASTIIWGFRRESDRDLALTGPTLLDGKEEVRYLCLKNLYLARRTRDTWELVRRDLGSRQDIWAYSPASAQRWYATRAACEKGLKRGAVAKRPYTGCM